MMILGVGCQANGQQAAENEEQATAVSPATNTPPATRLLVHPHVDERPFTRSQSGIVIPASVTSVTVRAHDLLDGFGGKEVVVDLTAVSSTDFETEK